MPGWRSSVSSSTGAPARMPLISRIFPAFVVASTRFTSLFQDVADDRLLERDQLADARVREFHQRLERAFVERRPLRGALQLDEAAVAGLDEVHVHLGARILFVREVE